MTQLVGSRLESRERFPVNEPTHEVDDEHGLPPPLLPDVGVIALVPDLWDSRWQSRHYILSRLARYFHVVWCNPTLVNSRRPSPDPRRPDTPPGFTVHDPPWWVREFYRPALARLMTRVRYRAAGRELRRRGCDRVLLSLWRPSYAAALDLVPHHVSCYHIDDEYTFADVEQATDEREARLIRMVDQVFISSPGLLEKKGQLNPNTLLLPNGVNYAAYVRPWPEPADLQSIPHPRLGYVGVVKKQLDLQLIYALAQRHALWSFVFVGPHIHPEDIGPLVQKLADLPNVHFLGEKPVSALPAYTQHLDVCLLCYKVDGYTKFIYPLKLHESLAGGHPCVGSTIRTFQEFSGVLDLASTVEEWSKTIAAALTPAARAETRKVARREVARHHDWDGLVHQIATALGDRLGANYRQRVQQGMPASRPWPWEA